MIDINLAMKLLATVVIIVSVYMLIKHGGIIRPRCPKGGHHDWEFDYVDPKRNSVYFCTKCKTIFKTSVRIDNGD